MKILLVSVNHAPEQTGIGKYQGEMAAWLVRRGHSVRVITTPPHYPEWKIHAGYTGRAYRTEILDGAKVVRVPVYVPASPTGLRRVLHLLSFGVTSAPVILKETLLWRPDVVFVTEPPLTAVPMALLGAFLCGARTQLHVLDFEVDAAFQLGILKPKILLCLVSAVERFLMRGFRIVSTLTPRMRERLLAKGVPEARALLLPIWANVEDFDHAPDGQEWRLQQGIDPNTIIALYSGNLGQKQGLETIVGAARLLESETKIRFIVAGDGSGRAQLMDMARGLSNISFLPVQPRDSFVPMMRAADLHLLPQRAQAADLVMPSKLGNILASGRPVVAGASSGTQLFDAVQGCGFAVPPDDAKAFAAAIRQLADDKALRETTGAEGIRRAHAEWSRETLLTRMEAGFSS